ILRAALASATLMLVVVLAGCGKAPEHDQTVVYEVVTTNPRLKDYEFAVSQPAYIDPYYKAEIRARVAGGVEDIVPDIGTVVARGELLIKIQVPDLREDVAKKAAVVKQREQEAQVARAMIVRAREMLNVAEKTIEAKQYLAKAASKTYTFREDEAVRF